MFVLIVSCCVIFRLLYVFPLWKLVRPRIVTLELPEMTKTSEMPQIRSSDSRDSDLCKTVKIPCPLFEITIAWLWMLEVQATNLLCYESFSNLPG